MDTTFTLAFVWAGLIAFAVIAYVVLDGFDLGVGILFPFMRDSRQRDLMMNSVAPFWDGNETWLVLGGGGLMAVFPLAYAIILPALYAPLIAMLLALIFRGVAFEYRHRTERGRFLWDWSFTIGSGVAAFCQGLALGTLVHGIPVEGRAYAGGWWDWLTPFSVLTGFAVVVGYTLLGSTWLVMKTEGALQERARQIARYALFGTLALIGGVSIWTPFIEELYFHRWFDWPTVIFSGIVPILMLFCAWEVWSGLGRGHHWRPFAASVGIFLLCYLGIAISFYPYIVPTSVTIETAAAPDRSLWFLLAGAIILIPTILAYTAYAYWTFRGKVREGEGYH